MTPEIKSLLAIVRQLERAEEEYPRLAAPDGTVAVNIADLRHVIDSYDRMRDTLALGTQNWAVCHYGSEPMKGDTIYAVDASGGRGKDVAYLGCGEHAHAAAGAIVAAHNAALAELAPYGMARRGGAA